jgi:hypothetical protein
MDSDPQVVKSSEPQYVLCGKQDGNFCGKGCLQVKESPWGSLLTDASSLLHPLHNAHQSMHIYYI